MTHKIAGTLPAQDQHKRAQKITRIPRLTRNLTHNFGSFHTASGTQPAHIKQVLENSFARIFTVCFTLLKLPPSLHTKLSVMPDPVYSLPHYFITLKTATYEYRRKTK